MSVGLEIRSVVLQVVIRVCWFRMDDGKSSVFTDTQKVMLKPGSAILHVCSRAL